MTTRSRQLAKQHIEIVIERLAGPDAVPREDQIDAVEATISEKSRVLVVQATGWGKSAVYWAATSALRSLGLGPTLVVSPLLALMRNQVQAATKAGLSAATINSSNLDDWDDIYTQLKNDDFDVLLISPERLGNPRFAAQLDDLLSRVGLVVIDEAHCISDWGFDFRPDYQRLARVLLSTPHASVLSTTATANTRVTRDVERQMGPDTITFRGTLARTSLSLAVVPGLEPLERYAWVGHALADMPGSGIIYVLTVAEADKLAGFLSSAGYTCRAYTGQMSNEEREVIEGQLLRNEIKAVVATSALGMGYDKPDLGFCLHVGSPSTPVAYYQQVGRAGRGIDHAVAVLLPSESDEKIWEFFATASIPKKEDAEKVVSLLDQNSMGLLDIQSATGIRRGRLEALLKILAVEGNVARDGSRWQATGVRYIHDSVKWTALAEARAEEANLMRQFAGGRGCLMEFLQLALDDPDPGKCGRCSVCTGVKPGPGIEPDAKWLRQARDFARGIDAIVEPRKQWPRGTHKGAILGLLEGRAVAFADDPAWNDSLRIMNNKGFSRIPTELLAGAVETLTRWSQVWDVRPTWVMPAPAFGVHAEANRLLAEHVARVGRRPLVEPFEWIGGPAPRDSASGPVVQHLDEVIRMRDGVDLPQGPVLLCSVEIRTKWTSCVVARLLREAGAGPVMPFAIHQVP
jgi:ATP-dependent DNA helicase RecQ